MVDTNHRDRAIWLYKRFGHADYLWLSGVYQTAHFKNVAREIAIEISIIRDVQSIKENEVLWWALWLSSRFKSRKYRTMKANEKREYCRSIAADIEKKIGLENT